MKITILGSGASIITKGRRSTSFVVETNGQILLFEAGWGVPEALLDANIDIQKIDHIFITHHDSDHLGSLMSLMQSILVTNTFVPERKRQKPLCLHGYSGFKDEYQKLRSILFTGKTDYPVIIEEYDNSDRKADNFRVTSYKVPHSQKFQSVGFRLESEGKVIAYSGDTGYDDVLIDLARNADVAIIEMSFGPARYREFGQPTTHLWTGDCAKIAAQAKARKLVLVHLQDSGDANEVAGEIKKVYTGEAVLASDGLVIKV